MKPTEMQYSADLKGYIGITSEGKRLFVDQDEWAEHEQADPPVPLEMLRSPDLWTPHVGEERIYYLTTGYEQALQRFLDDEQAFPQAVIDAGKLIDHGGYLDIELFSEGTYRLRNQLCGDGAKGLRLSIPGLSDEEYREVCQEAGSSDDEKLVSTLLELEWPLAHIRSTLEEALATYETSE